MKYMYINKRAGSISGNAKVFDNHTAHYTACPNTKIKDESDDFNMITDYMITVCTQTVIILKFT